MTVKNEVESILFATGKRTSVEEISKLVRKNPDEVKKALQELQKDYDARDSALMITASEDSWKIDVKEKYSHLCRNIISEMDLDKQTIETLAMVAYTQPCVQSEVIKRRTNKAYDHIKVLGQLGFVTKEPYKRTRLVKLTQKFYNYFDINRDEIEGLFDKFKKIDEKTELAVQEIQKLGEEKKKQEEDVKKKEKEKKDNAINIIQELDNVDDGVAYEERDPEEVPDYDRQEKLRLGLAAERAKRKPKAKTDEAVQAQDKQALDELKEVAEGESLAEDGSEASEEKDREN